MTRLTCLSAAAAAALLASAALSAPLPTQLPHAFPALSDSVPQPSSAPFAFEPEPTPAVAPHHAEPTPAFTPAGEPEPSPFAMEHAEASPEPSPDAMASPEPAVTASIEPVVNPVEVSAPRPSPAGAVAPEDTRRACLPAHALVRRADGRLVRVDEVRVGDCVEASPGEFSAVIASSHADAAARTHMVVVDAGDGARVALSPGHYVPVAGGRLVAARDLTPGTVLADGLRVRRTHMQLMTGLYNPQTAAGSLLARVGEHASPLVVSTYTDAVRPAAAHALLAPLRALHRASGLSVPALSQLVSLFQTPSTPSARPAPAHAAASAASLSALSALPASVSL